MKNKTIFRSILAFACIASTVSARAEQSIPTSIPKETLLDLNHAAFMAKLASINNHFLKLARDIDLHMIQYETRLLEVENAYEALENKSIRVEKALRHAKELFRIPRVLSRSVYLNDFLEKFLYTRCEDNSMLSEHFNEEFCSMVHLSEAILQILSEDEDVRNEAEERAPLSDEKLEEMRQGLDTLRKSARLYLQEQMKEFMRVEEKLEKLAEEMSLNHKTRCPLRRVRFVIEKNIKNYNKVLSLIGSEADLIGPSWRVLMEEALYDALFTNLIIEQDVGDEILGLKEITTKMKKGKVRRFIEKLTQ